MTTPVNSNYGGVCVAVFRPDPELLRRQLESIAGQTLATWTCHIGIDGHDENTALLVAELVRDDDRFVIHHFPHNVGFYRNFERTIDAANVSSPGWIALADQDDFWYPEKLERLVAALDRRNAMAISGQARVVDREGSLIARTTRTETSLVGLLFDNQVTGSMSVFDRAVLSVALPFPEPTDAAYHDHWLGVVAKTLGRVEFLDECLQDYVQHGANVLGEEKEGGMRDRIGALRARSRAGGGAIRYLAVHRWGWRVAMARTLLNRAGDAPSASQMRHVARGTLSPRIFRDLATAARTREMPTGRGLGLLAGALGWSIYDLDEAHVTHI